MRLNGGPQMLPHLKFGWALMKLRKALVLRASSIALSSPACCRSTRFTSSAHPASKQLTLPPPKPLHWVAAWRHRQALHTVDELWECALAMSRRGVSSRQMRHSTKHGEAAGDRDEGGCRRGGESDDLRLSDMWMRSAELLYSFRGQGIDRTGPSNLINRSPRWIRTDLDLVLVQRLVETTQHSSLPYPPSSCQTCPPRCLLGR